MSIEPNKNPDFTSVMKMAEEYVENTLKTGWEEDDDFKQYLFEDVLLTIYGKNIFKDIAEKIKEKRLNNQKINTDDNLF